jgi:hypothetical protein
MIQAFAALTELLFGDLSSQDETIVETPLVFINKRGEELPLKDIMNSRVVTIVKISYLLREPANGFWGIIGFKKNPPKEIAHEIRDDKIGVSFHCNEVSLKISIWSKSKLPKLHRYYNKKTICLKYNEEDGFSWHIYLPISSFIPVDWV